MLRYAEWRAVIAQYVAARLDLEPDDLLPRMVGDASLALALSAYGQWLDTPRASLRVLLDSAMAMLVQRLGDRGNPRPTKLNSCEH